MVPIERKYLLTIQEASEYSEIGEKKIRELIKMPHCPFVLYNGKKALIKREKFEKYIDNIEGSI